MKHCPVCNQGFIFPTGKGGITKIYCSSKCRKKANNSVYYKANLEKLKEYNRHHYWTKRKQIRRERLVNDPAYKVKLRRQRQSWDTRHRDKKAKHNRDAYMRVKIKVLMAYGSQCRCCGETEPFFLTIDHTNNDGSAHRKQVGKLNIYRWLMKQKFPQDKFQLLCANCNMAKQTNKGICPHQQNLRRATLANS